MKKIALCCLVFFAPVYLFSQDCKYEKFKDRKSGSTAQAITSTTKLGKFIVGKTGDTLYAVYTMKLIFAMAQDTHNMTTLLIDSVRFNFDNNTWFTTTVAGTGRVENTVKLKPQFQFVSFSLIMPPPKIQALTENHITSFLVYGEKGAQLGDVLTEKQSANLSQAVRCIKLL